MNKFSKKITLIMFSLMFVFSLITSSLTVEAKKRNAHVDHSKQSGSYKGNAYYTYHYAVDTSRNALVVIAHRGNVRINLYEYQKAHHKLPCKNADKESGYPRINGLPVRINGSKYTEEAIRKALTKWMNEVGASFPNGKMLWVKGKVNYIIYLEDDDPPKEQNDEHRYEDISRWYLKQLTVDYDYSEFIPKDDGKVKWNEKSHDNYSDLLSNDGLDAESVWNNGAGDLEQTEDNPYIYKTRKAEEDEYGEAKSTATYKKVRRREWFVRTKITTVDANGNTHIWYTPWRHDYFEYKFLSNSKVIDQSKGYKANIEDPSMYDMDGLDLTTEEHKELDDIQINSYDCSYYDETDDSITGKLKNKIIDKSGLEKGEEFSLTSMNIPQSFTVKNTDNSWFGIDTKAGPGNLSLGNEKAGGPEHHQFVSKVTLHYGPYTENDDSTKRNSVEFIHDGVSDGETTSAGEYTITKDLEAVTECLFKIRSIKYGDYRLGTYEDNCYWLDVDCNRHNKEGWDWTAHAYDTHSEPSNSNLVFRTDRSDYTNIILVANFVHPYLNGDFAVKDVAGSN